MARPVSPKKPKLLALIDEGWSLQDAADHLGVNSHTAKSWRYRHQYPDKVYEKDGRQHKARVAAGRPPPPQSHAAPSVVQLPPPSVHPADVLSVQALREEIATAKELCIATQEHNSFQAAVSANKHLRILREKLEALQQTMKHQKIETTEGAVKDVIRMLSADQDLRRAVLDHFHS